MSLNISKEKIESVSYQDIMNQVQRKLLLDLQKEKVDINSYRKISRFLSSLSFGLDNNIIKNVHL